MPTSPWSTLSRQGEPGRRDPASAGPGRRGASSIELKRFRGKITFVDPELQPVAENAVRIRAEFENPAPYHLKPGLKVQMTIFVTSDNTAANSPADQPTRTARAQ